MAARTVDEIVELGELFRLPIAALGNGSTIRDTEYATDRGVFVRNPAGFHQPRAPWLMARCAPAPLRDTAALDDGYFDVQACNDSNRVELFVFGNESQVLLMSRLDNLGKGASGAAVSAGPMRARSSATSRVSAP